MPTLDDLREALVAREMHAGDPASVQQYLHRRRRSSRRRYLAPMLATVAVVGIAAGTAAVTGAHTGTRRPEQPAITAPATSTSVMPPDSGERAAIAAIEQLALASGGTRPIPIDYIETSREAGYQLLFPDESDANAYDPSMPEVLLVAHGSFNNAAVKGPRRPSNAPRSPHPRYLYALYSPSLRQITDWGLTSVSPNIGMLGTVSETSGP